MVKTLLTIGGALLVTMVSLIFLRRDLSGNGGDLSLGKLNFLSTPSNSIKTLVISDQSYQVVVADSPEKREKGLSGTNQVPEQGMLFIFDQRDIHQFWMKDMKYDLDFIWIADDRVVDISANVVHPEDNASTVDLPIYAPSEPVTMMLEVPAGFADQVGIKIGSSVSLSD